MPVLIGTFEDRSPEWHAARAPGIGSSEIAAVLGLSPWESPFSLWHRKAGNVPADIDDNDSMEWGRRLEPVIAAKFADEHPELVITNCGTYHAADRPWQRANPDRMVYDAGEWLEPAVPGAPVAVLEIKNVRTRDGWGEPGTDEVPIYYRTQVLWQLDVMGVDVGHMAVLIGGSDYREYVIERDEAECAELRDAAQAFLDSVEAGDAPDIDAHGATYVAIQQMHPDIEDVDIEVPDDLALEWIDARGAVASAAHFEALAKNRLADLMGTARRAVWQGRSLATRQVRGDGAPFIVAGRNLSDLATPDTEENAA